MYYDYWSRVDEFRTGREREVFNIVKSKFPDAGVEVEIVPILRRFHDESVICRLTIIFAGSVYNIPADVLEDSDTFLEYIERVDGNGGCIDFEIMRDIRLMGLGRQSCYSISVVDGLIQIDLEYIWERELK